MAGLALALSACSLVYELLAARTLSLYAHNSVVWYSAAVGVYLACMGVGAWWSGRLRSASLWRTLFRVEIALTLVGAASVPLLVLAHGMYSYLGIYGREQVALAAFLGTAALVVIVVGLLTGIELPVLMRLGARTGGVDDGEAAGDATPDVGPAGDNEPDDEPDDEAHDEAHDEARANTVLGVDYMGSLLGGLLFPLVLLPNLSLARVGFVTAAVNLTAALVIASWPLRRAPGAGGRAAILACMLAGLGMSLLRTADLDAWTLRSYYYYIEASDSLAERFGDLSEFPDVLRRRSPYQRIDLVQDVAPDFSADLMPAYSTKLEADPDYPLDWILFLDGAFQTNTRYDEVYHEWFAHVPISANGAVPRDVLVLGGGDGLLMRELVKYEDIESITHVDIDATLVDLASTHTVLRHANADAFDDPRIERLVTDGFQYMRHTDGQWDGVFIDFPVANDYDLAKLYSREFFWFVRQRIAPGGFAVFDSTGTSIIEGFEDPVRNLTEANDWPIYRDTLRAAGFETIVPYLTTLDREQPGAIEALEASGRTFEVGQALYAALEAEQDPERKQQLRRGALQAFVDVHVISLEQGFIMLCPEARAIDPLWRDPGVALHVLDEARFEAAFDVAFPFPDGIDPDKVNSILRPTLPTAPWWQPRLPY